MKSPILYQRAKTGKVFQWQVYTVGPVIYREFGQVGGKLQLTIGTECLATNVGRSNERNPTQQAEFEAESLVKEHLRLKYSMTVPVVESVRMQPMLANDGHKVKFTFPIDVQYKYDGLRCMWDGENLMSRGNKIYNIPHIKDAMLKLFPDTMADGELYIHGVSLQELNSLVKKYKAASLELEYHIYDIPGEGTWAERKELLNQIKSDGPIKIAWTESIGNISALNIYHDRVIALGYEGLILRPANGLYEFGNRSRTLLKWKASEDAEFRIIGMTTGTGKYSETPVFKCKNDINDLTFDVVPVGTMAVKKSMLDEANIGKLLTVKFIGRTDDGIPKFAVGKAIRIDGEHV